MPNSLNKNGISRKISDFEKRKKLREIIENLNVPQKMSVIIRTAGIEKSKKEIGGQEGPEPTRYGDWEKKGITSDF